MSSPPPTTSPPTNRSWSPTCRCTECAPSMPRSVTCSPGCALSVWWLSPGWPSCRVASVGLRQPHLCQNHNRLAKPHDREGAPHTNGVTFLVTTRVSSFELQLTSEECAEWLTVAGSLDGE